MEPYSELTVFRRHRNPWYTLRPIAGDVATVLACQWEARLQSSTRMAPSGCIDIVWVDDGSMWLIGPESKPWTGTAFADRCAVGVRFWPGTAPTILRERADDLRDQRLPLDDVLGCRARRLAEQVGESADRLGCLVDGLQWWVERRQPLSNRDALIAYLVTSQQLTVNDIALEVGVTPRQVHRRSRHLFGLGPTLLRRVLRLQRFRHGTLRLGHRPTAHNLAQLAVVNGYYDQSHLTLDCSDIVGLTPSEFLADGGATWLLGSDPAITISGQSRHLLLT